MSDTTRFQIELEKKITKHLEAWADWSRMSEDERDETFDEIYNIVLWALEESKKERS
jgi:hypothetical protein